MRCAPACHLASAADRLLCMESSEGLIARLEKLFALRFGVSFVQGSLFVGVVFNVTFLARER